MMRDLEAAGREFFGFIIGAAIIMLAVACFSVVIWMALVIIANPAELDMHWRPNPITTPGEINDNIDQSNIGQTLCNRHWSTKSIRPDEDFTTSLKRKQLAQYGYASRNLKLYEEDHLISLEIGGHPTDPRNLWPEPWAGVCGAHVKDNLENKLHELVCAGKITLAEAQGEIASDWVRSFNLHVGKLVCP